MQPADRDPNRKYPPLPEEPHSRWSDVLLVSAFVLFVYIFIATGGFIPSWLPPTPTPFFRVPPSATALAARRTTPSPTPATPAATPTQSLQLFFYQQPDIRGAMVEIYTLNGTITGAYVRGKLEADTRLAQAFIKITDQTEVYVKTGDQYQLSALSELAKGDTVEVFFTAAAGQSAGGQAVAEDVVILK
jgi:hypothetical protein